MNAKRTVLFLIWLMMVVAYFDRVNITIAGPTIMAALHISKKQFGFVLSAFTLGYAVMQVPGGYLADRLGSKPLLIVALIVWSAFTAITGLVRSSLAMLGVRTLFGMGEGIENGSQFKLVGDYFDSKERSNANALFLTALAIGPALASPIAALLVQHVGWRASFVWFALMGVVVAGILAAFLPARKAGGSDIPADDVAKPSPTEWRDVLSRPQPWLAFGAYLFFNVAFWGFLGWIPTYLSDERHITLNKLGLIASIPYLCGFVGMMIIGRLGSTILYRRRGALVAACYIAAAAFFYATFRAPGLDACIAALSGAAFFMYGGFGPFWAIALDELPDNLRGALSGYVNLGGQIGGFIAPIVVGWIADQTKSFAGAFLFMMGALVLGAVCLVVLQGMDLKGGEVDGEVGC